MRSHFVASFAVSLVSLFAGCIAPGPADVVVRLPGGDCRAQSETGCKLDFGAASSQHVLVVDVVNEGGTKATLEAGAGQSGDLGGFALAAPPATLLQPGESSPLAVAASAPAPGATSAGTLSVLWLSGGGAIPEVSAPEDAPPMITVNLTAAGTAGDDRQCPALPACALSPTRVGATALCILDLHNDIADIETVDDIAVTGAGFSLSSMVLPNPVPGFTSLLVTVTAVPQAIGDQTATLSVRCGDVVETATLTVTGT